MPAYLVAVVVILTLLPDAKADFTVWLANLSLTQIYVPLTLTAGLTQMWSLCTEVAFYLVMPLTAYLLAASRRRPSLSPVRPQTRPGPHGCVFKRIRAIIFFYGGNRNT
jgi:peptidoglycan/LPS O-acetylase OafA/YrhL